MLDAFPIYHWFHNGNPYSGAEGGMRYVITPIKVPDPSDESGKKKREALCAEVWPGPWSIEHTAEEKIETQLFDGDQAGLDKAVAWLHERYTAEADRWTDIPSILDCEPGPAEGRVRRRAGHGHGAHPVHRHLCRGAQRAARQAVRLRVYRGRRHALSAGA